MISQETISQLFEQYPLNTVFHKIRNKEYMKLIPRNAKLGVRTITYAGFTISIPALLIEQEYAKWG